MKKSFLISLICVVLAESSHATDPSAKLYINENEAYSMAAGSPASWLFEYLDEKGRTYEHLMMMHDKKVHLLVVPDSLETMYHIHPTQVGIASGLFQIDINQASADPDNLEAAIALKKPGKYYLFSEIMGMETPMMTLPLDFLATGKASSDPKPVWKPDPLNSDGNITKYFNAVGEVAAEGALYRVDLKTLNSLQCLNLMSRFMLNIKMKVGANYESVKDIERWLGRYAHGILLSVEGSGAKDKVFRHVHGVYPNTGDLVGPDLILLLDNHVVGFKDGTYRFWVQLKRAGKILKFPFTIDLAKPAGLSCKQ